MSRSLSRAPRPSGAVSGIENAEPEIVMTAEQLVSIVASVSRYLTAENRALAARFVGVLATHSETIPLADDDRARRRREPA